MSTRSGPVQSRKAGQCIGGRGCQRECLQDPGRPGNAPEGQVGMDCGLRSCAYLYGRQRDSVPATVVDRPAMVLETRPPRP
jgi:hypothetical protein